MFYETYIEFYSLFDDDSDNEKNIEMRLNIIMSIMIFSRMY